MVKKGDLFFSGQEAGAFKGAIRGKGWQAARRRDEGESEDHACLGLPAWQGGYGSQPYSFRPCQASKQLSPWLPFLDQCRHSVSPVVVVNADLPQLWLCP